MWGLDTLGLPINADGSITLPLWALAAVGVLLLVLFVLALVRTGAAGTLVFIALIGFGAWGLVTWNDHEAAAQRRGLEQSALALGTQTFASGSSLACLQPTGIDAVDTACERAVFASPESTAAALALVAQRIMLLDQQTSFAGGRNAGFDDTFNTLRTSLEQDRFGVVAQVLATRYGCTKDHCDILRLLHDPAKVRNNLRDRTFDAAVARHAPTWAAAEVTPTLAVPAAGTAGIIPGTVAAPIPDRYTLPSAASIPPVSIMAPEAAPPPAKPPAPAPRRVIHRAPPGNPPVQLHPPAQQ